MFRRFLSMLLACAMLCAYLPMAAAETQVAAQATVHPAVSPAPGTYTVMQSGMTDVAGEIVALQERLIEMGFLSGKADGSFGESTRAAVRDFQAYNGMTPTGIADARTQALLFESDINDVSPAAYNNKNSIYKLQELMAIYGFMHGSVDGISGKATEDGIVNFKRYLDTYYRERYPEPTPEPTPAPTMGFGFSDGMVAVDTLAADSDTTYSVYITDELMRYVSGEEYFSVYNEDLSMGASGEEVLRLQTRLQQLEYMYDVDGEFGEATDRALKYFQYRNGMKQTGIADEATQTLLFSDDAIESDQLVTQYKLVVDISEQLVYVYQWSGTGHLTPRGTMICSTGAKDSPTPLGHYQAVGRSGQGEWYYFSDLDVYAKWGYYIIGDIMFHSVVYDADKSLRTGTVAKLGTQASHGCVRLEEENAKWIYENCSSGTTVIVQE